MTQDKLTVGNKLIAEFMGKKTVDNICERCGHDVTKSPTCSSYRYRNHALGGRILELEYHKSWDWLMPVVEKINNDHFFNIEIYGDFACVWVTKDKDLPNNDRKIYSEHKDPLTAVYGAVVQFIQWHKNNK